MKSRASGRRVRNERLARLFKGNEATWRARKTLLTEQSPAFPTGSASVVRKYYSNGFASIDARYLAARYAKWNTRAGPANKSLDYLIGEHAVSDSLSFNWNPIVRAEFRNVIFPFRVRKYHRNYILTNARRFDRNISRPFHGFR